MMTTTNFMQRRRSPTNLISSMNNESLRLTSSKTPNMLSSEQPIMLADTNKHIKRKPTQLSGFGSSTNMNHLNDGDDIEHYLNRTQPHLTAKQYHHKFVNNSACGFQSIGSPNQLKHILLNMDKT